MGGRAVLRAEERMGIKSQAEAWDALHFPDSALPSQRAGLHKCPFRKLLPTCVERSQ